jgi:hypothetical protein
MTKRLTTLGIVLAVLGLGFLVGGGVAFAKVQAGYDSLQAFSKAENVQLEYNDKGQLMDHGDPAGAKVIMDRLTKEWKYPVVKSDFDPNDPLVNTASEYMYQMATITTHTLEGEATVTLDQPVTYQGKTYQAGEPITFKNDGRYWTGFDREDPVQGAAREALWTGTAHGLIGELGVGTVTASALQLGLALSGVLAGLGFTVLVLGLGLVWAGRATSQPAAQPAAEGTGRPVAA